MDLFELEQAFYDDGYLLAGNVTEEAGNSSLKDSMDQFYASLDQFILLFLQQAEKEQPAHCRKGCSWCCHQEVFAQAYELKYLRLWMFDHLDAQQLEEIRKKASEKIKHTSKMSRDERLKHKEPCPLLEKGACIAYEARPVACRIYLSMNVQSCEYEFNDPYDKSRFPLLFELPLKAGRKLNEGFSARLNENDIDTTEYPLEEGLLLK